MKQLVILLSVMTCSFYYSQIAANSSDQPKDSYHQEELIASLDKPIEITTSTSEANLLKSTNITSSAPQSDICPPFAPRSFRTVLPETGCKQYVYCVYKRDGSRQLFSSYIYTCPTTSKFNPTSQKCTAAPINCPS